MLTKYYICSGAAFMFLSCVYAMSGGPNLLAVWLMMVACFFELLAIALKP